MRASWSRWASLTGLVFGVLLIVAIFVSGSSPDSDWSAQRVVSWYTTHHRSQNATVYLLAYGALFTLFFAAALRSHLRSRSASDGLIAVGFSGGILFALGLALAAAVLSALIDAPGKISPAAEQALSVLGNDLAFIPLLVGLVAFGVGNGIAIAISGVLPKWLGWLGIVIGIVAAIPMVGFFALFAVTIWASIVSIVMFIREGQPTAAPAAAVDPAAA